MVSSSSSVSSSSVSVSVIIIIIPLQEVTVKSLMSNLMNWLQLPKIVTQVLESGCLRDFYKVKATVFRENVYASLLSEQILWEFCKCGQ